MASEIILYLEGMIFSLSETFHLFLKSHCLYFFKYFLLFISTFEPMFLWQFQYLCTEYVPGTGHPRMVASLSRRGENSAPSPTELLSATRFALSGPQFIFQPGEKQPGPEATPVLSSQAWVWGGLMPESPAGWQHPSHPAGTRAGL